MYKSTVVDLNMGNNIEEFKIKEYPCIVIKGLSYDWEIDYFANRKNREEYSWPLYMENKGDYFKVGLMEFNSSNLIDLYNVGVDEHLKSNYELWIYKSETDKSKIDYTDGNVIAKFIELE